MAFTIDGLPEDHYGLKVEAEVMMMQFTGGDDGDSANLTAAGATPVVDYADDGSGNGYFDMLVVQPDHTGTSAVITLSGTGEYEWEEYETFGLMEFRVYVLRHNVSNGSATATVGGDAEEFIVTVTKDDGTPASGVSVDVESLNTGVITVYGAGTTDASGQATVEITGNAPGYAQLKATTQGGGAATTQAAALKITKTGTPPMGPLNVNTQNGVILSAQGVGGDSLHIDIEILRPDGTYRTISITIAVTVSDRG